MNSNNFSADSKPESIESIEDFEQNMKIAEVYAEVLSERAVHRNEVQVLKDRIEAGRVKRRETKVENERALQNVRAGHLTEVQELRADQETLQAAQAAELRTAQELQVAQAAELRAGQELQVAQAAELRVTQELQVVQAEKLQVVQAEKLQVVLAERLQRMLAIAFGIGIVILAVYLHLTWFPNQPRRNHN